MIRTVPLTRHRSVFLSLVLPSQKSYQEISSCRRFRDQVDGGIISRRRRQRSLVMPEITLILKDDDRNQSQKTFQLQGNLDELDGIDEAVEQFKSQALPQVEQQLLAQAQERAILQEKKTVPDG